jgi:YgiT-type zinc finger domain-containing protein
MGEYEPCPCGGVYERRWVEVRMTVDDRPVVLTDVPRGSCPACGSHVYKAEVLHRIEATMKDLAITVTAGEPA